MQNPKVVNAIIFGIIFLALAPFLGGLIWGTYMVKVAVSETGKSLGMPHLNMIYITLISAYKHIFFPTMFAGFIGGWWRSSYKSFSACFLFGLFAATTISVFKYIEYVVIQTPYMEATNWQYLQLILIAYALPAFIISTFIARIARIR